MRNFLIVSLTVLVALAGCGDMTHNLNDDTGTPAGNDLDADGVTDGWDQDEVLGPMKRYPGEVDISVGALSEVWYPGEAMTFACRHQNGLVVEFWWGYLDGEEYQDTWFTMQVDDRLPEGSAVCGLTQNGLPILDFHQTDVMVWSSKTLCVHQGADGVYVAPGFAECDDLRPPW